MLICELMSKGDLHRHLHTIKIMGYAEIARLIAQIILNIVIVQYTKSKRGRSDVAELLQTSI